MGARLPSVAALEQVLAPSVKPWARLDGVQRAALCGFALGRPGVSAPPYQQGIRYHVPYNPA